MAQTWDRVSGPAGSLAVHAVASPGASPAPDGALVVVHNFPVVPASADTTGRSLPALAARIAAESGWPVLCGCLRGVGGSSGDFSLAGWLEDLRTLVDVAVADGGRGGVWLVGFGTTGALAFCLAAQDERVRGVATLGSPSSFDDWAHDLPGMVAFARTAGVITSDGYPADVAAWGAAFSALRPAAAAAAMGRRPVLIVHGAEDDAVPVSDARTLAEAAGPQAELRILPGAGHRLRADPRAVALLVGWLERQGP
jgi:putative redox protein